MRSTPIFLSRPGDPPLAALDLAVDAEGDLSPGPRLVWLVEELHRRRAAGYSMKRLALWFETVQGDPITPSALWRLLTLVAARPADLSKRRRRSRRAGRRP